MYIVEAYSVFGREVANEILPPQVEGSQGPGVQRRYFMSQVSAIQALERLSLFDVVTVRQDHTSKVLCYHQIQRPFTKIEQWAIERLVRGCIETAPLGAVVGGKHAKVS